MLEVSLMRGGRLLLVNEYVGQVLPKAIMLETILEKEDPLAWREQTGNWQTATQKRSKAWAASRIVAVQQLAPLGVCTPSSDLGV